MAKKSKKRYTFNRKINTFYKLSERERTRMLVKALEKSNKQFAQKFTKKIGKREKYLYAQREQGVTWNNALISGFLSSKFRGKLGTEYKIIKMAERGVSGEEILRYIRSTIHLKRVSTTIDNQDLILQLVEHGIVYIKSSSAGSNNARVIYLKDLTQAGKVIVIPDSQFQRMSVDDVLILFGRISGKRSIETDDIPIIYTDKKR